MSKLLSDEELATQLIVMAKRIGASLDDAIDAKIEQNIVSLIRTEKLKAQIAILQEGISESKEFCGEDVDINLGWVNFKLNKLQQSLTKLEAEL